MTPETQEEAQILQLQSQAFAVPDKSNLRVYIKLGDKNFPA